MVSRINLYAELRDETHLRFYPRAKNRRLKETARRMVNALAHRLQMLMRASGQRWQAAPCPPAT